MSHSRRHTPITGITTAASEKADKIIYHRRWRHSERARLIAALDRDGGLDHLTTLPNEVSDVWSWEKDGKAYWDRDHLRRYIKRIWQFLGK